jgi:hypothetical protein
MREIVDYDVVPEIEQLLHQLIKRIHQSMDKLPDEEEEIEPFDAKAAAEDPNYEHTDIIQRGDFLRKDNEDMKSELEKERAIKKKYQLAI